MMKRGGYRGHRKAGEVNQLQEQRNVVDKRKLDLRDPSKLPSYIKKTVVVLNSEEAVDEPIEQLEEIGDQRIQVVGENGDVGVRQERLRIEGTLGDEDDSDGTYETGRTTSRTSGTSTSEETESETNSESVEEEEEESELDNEGKRMDDLVRRDGRTVC